MSEPRQHILHSYFKALKIEPSRLEVGPSALKCLVPNSELREQISGKHLSNRKQSSVHGIVG